MSSNGFNSMRSPDALMKKTSTKDILPRNSLNEDVNELQVLFKSAYCRRRTNNMKSDSWTKLREI